MNWRITWIRDAGAAVRQILVGVAALLIRLFALSVFANGELVYKRIKSDGSSTTVRMRGEAQVVHAQGELRDPTTP